jgi:hypothetical protein
MLPSFLLRFFYSHVQDANAIPLLLAILDIHVVGVKYQSAKLLSRCMQLKPAETCTALIQHPHALGTFVEGTTATPYLRNGILLLSFSVFLLYTDLFDHYKIYCSH